MRGSLRSKPSFLGLAAAVTARSCGLGLAGARLSALALPAVRSFPQKPLVPRASCSSHSPVLRPDRSLTHRWAALARIDPRSFLALRIPLFFASHLISIPPQHEIQFYALQN